MLTVEEVSSENQWEAIKGPWDELSRGNPDYAPFLAHEWFDCCLRAYKRGKDQLIFLIRDGGTPVGIAPFWRSRDVVWGVPIRKIGFIAVPDTPFADFIIAGGRQEEVLRAILGHLYAERWRTWDVLALPQWPVESPLYKALRALLQEQGKRFSVSVASMTPYIPLQGKWEAFLEERSARFRKTRRNIINRVNKLGSVEVQCVRQDSAGTVLREILAVSERSWKHRAGIAISSREEARRFFEALGDVGTRKGWLLVWLLKVDDRPIAMEYDLSYGGKVYALRADFDAAYEGYSPGAYLEYHIVKHLLEAGYLEYSTGPGLNTYKLHWTGQWRENLTLCVYNNTLRGRLIWGWGKTVPLLRRLRELRAQLRAHR